MRCLLPIVHHAAVAALFAAVVPAQAPNASGGPLLPSQACYDVRHVTLRITVAPDDKTIAGEMTLRADSVESSERLRLDLDAPLQVRRVLLDGVETPFEREGHHFDVLPVKPLAPGSAFTLTVDYGGAPRVALNPPWTGGFTWKETADGEPWIATSCQGEGADLWWPCKDHPSDKPDGFDLFCTVPKGLVVASNGLLAAEPVADGDRVTFHWRTRSPIANYNICLNIAPYVELHDVYESIDGTKVPVSFFVLPESVANAKRCMPQFLDHVRVFEQILGPYPFRSEKYGIAETPHLGMEHQTMLAYGNGFRDFEYDWLHNHELAHEWWGNLVTCRDWKDMWLHEGFGTYMQPLYRERRFGKQSLREELTRQRSMRLMNRTPIAPRESRTSHEIYFGRGGGNDLYYKGSLVLHTLRHELGDAAFFTLLQRFCYPTEAARKATDGSQVRFVDTDELVAMCSEIAGRDLSWFFELYVRQPGLPRLVQERRDGVLHLSWRTPGDLLCELSVPVVVQGMPQKVPMPGGKGQLEVGDADLQIDPEQWLLMLKPELR